MTELYIFSQDDRLLTILSETTGLISAPLRDELNRVAENSFSFTIEADTEQSEHVVEENQVVFRDKEGDYRLFTIKELEDVDNNDGPTTTAICEPGFMENKERIIEDISIIDKSALEALQLALLPTRWEGEAEVDLGTSTTSFYYITSIDAVWKIREVWGGDIKDTVEFDGNRITRRVIKLLQRRGADRGKRFEIDHDIEEIKRTVLSYPVTALYGRGASLETEGGGYTRYIDFADVEWKKTNGDPVDKPLGQKWVGDPDALIKYGYEHNGELLHREDIFSNQDYDNSQSLLWATWEAVQQGKVPEVNYQLSVNLFEHLAGYEHEHVELGDTARTIDRRFRRPIEIEARVISIEYDLLNIEDTAVVELGQFLSAHFDNRLDRVIETVENNRGKWESTTVITDDKIENVIPSMTTGVEAIGSVKTVIVKWDYVSALYISNYEVYASQIAGFTPDSSNLVFRGKTSFYTHNADSNQQWYFRVRGVNTHGIAGQFSDEVSAQTARVISQDILFGPEVAAELRNLSLTAKLLADKTVDASLMAANSITAANAAIASLAVGSAAFQNLSVKNGHLDYLSVGTAQLQDLVVTGAKIAKLAVDDSHIANLSADKINAGTIIGINIKGSRFYSTDGKSDFTVQGGYLELDLSGVRRLTISPTGLYGYDSDGTTKRYQVDESLVMSAALGTSQANVYLASKGETRSVDYASIPGDGLIDSYSYTPVRASGFYGNFWNYNPAIAGLHLYARPLSDGELRITLNGTTDTYENLRASGVYANVLENNALWGVSGHIYLRPKIANEIRVTAAGTTDHYEAVRASGFYGAFIDQGGDMGGTHFYVRPAGGAELRVTVRGTTGTYLPVRSSEIFANTLDTNGNNYLFIKCSTAGEVRFTASGTTTTYVNTRANTSFATTFDGTRTDLSDDVRVSNSTGRFVGGGTYTYVQTSGSEIRATKYMSGTLVPMRAESHPTTSSLNTKTNIEEFTEEEAFYLLNNTNIYKYHMKRNIEDGVYDKPKIGLITEMSPALLRDEDGVDPYSIVSTLFKIAKVQDKRIIALEQRVSDLESIA